MKRLLVLISLIATSSLFAQEEVDQLAVYQQALTQSERNDLVLRHMELGLYALQTGNREIARSSLDYALADIESLFSGNDDAVKARSLWYEEGKKSFKGEPYERALAYYYRGILYLMEGEPDNARASFLSGQLQDAFAEEDQHRTDFALLMAMEAWAAQLMGSEHLLEQALSDLSVLRPGFPIPSPDSHTLVIVETGKSPRKIRDGISGESLVYRRGKKFKDKYASIEFSDEQMELSPIEDIFFQATTRGNRVIDRINKGKAVYKATWNDTGTSIADLANQLTLFDNLTRDYSQLYSAEMGIEVEYSGSGVNFGAISIGASALALISSKIKPKADNRYWSNLPDTVHLGFVQKTRVASTDNLDVILFDKHNRPVKDSNVKLFGDDYQIGWTKTH